MTFDPGYPEREEPRDDLRGGAGDEPDDILEAPAWSRETHSEYCERIRAAIEARR